MLWHIVDTPHRLLGSMHQIPDGAAMPEWVEASHEGIERFVFESDHLKYPEKQFGLDPTKAHLRSYGAPEIYERAKKLLAGIGYNEPIDAFRPWRAARVVENRFVEHYGYLGTNGADERLRRLAEEKKLTAEFFESNSRSSELLEESCKNFQGGLAYFRLVVAVTKSGAGQSRLKRLLQTWLSSDFKEAILVRLKGTGRYLPQSLLGQAIDYALGQWLTLEIFLKDGRIEIDNNLVENAIRPTALGKKNWLFIGDADAGQRSAIIYTVIENCRRRKLDPFAYLRNVLTRLPNMTNHQIPEVTPQAWAKAQPPLQRQAVS
jgi:hypothetical protein